ncbi:cobalamin synthesis protein P47K [Streptomyces sp. 769]|nr:cobalamin synthesis protein P47K [Streptomyces sp. 769]
MEATADSQDGQPREHGPHHGERQPRPGLACGQLLDERRGGRHGSGRDRVAGGTPASAGIPNCPQQRQHPRGSLEGARQRCSAGERRREYRRDPGRRRARPLRAGHWRDQLPGPRAPGPRHHDRLGEVAHLDTMVTVVGAAGFLPELTSGDELVDQGLDQ